MRIVSLCPSLTESVFELGKGAELVGRTKFCVQPADRVDAVERVGGTKNPKLDRILALAPDLVLMNEEENRREDAEALTAAGVHVLSTFARDVPGTASALIAMGEAIGAASEARGLAARIEALAAEVAARAAGRARVTFAYLIWREPLMAVAPGTYIDALLTLAGGDNVVPASADRYPAIDGGVLARAARTLLSSEPFPFTERHLAELAAATGLGAERFALVDGERLSWHGARTLAGLAYAEQVLSF
jgi:ABC-type Fe3+-hydroxamate transport system substrate-binding protein